MVGWDSLWINANLATMATGNAAYGAHRDAALATESGRIAWLGPMANLPGPPDRHARHVHDAAGRWLTPGLIDCHTHIVFGGNRAGEFEQRLQGASYADIARAGGGILSTVTATRGASEEELVRAATPRVGRLRAEGVTTVEIKSGYGLDTDNECKTLRTARTLARQLPLTVQTTFLGAHALPPEFAARPDDYIALVCEEMLPAVAAAGLADTVDAFCESIAFSPAQTARVFEAAAHHGLRVKLHADQLSDLGGAALAARFGGLSADHLEYASEDGVAAMAAAGTVAVLLPGAFYALGETRRPPIEAFRAHGMPIAIATDANPGSSPVLSLLLMLSMACTLLRLTPEEALAGVTRHGAAALGLADRGTLEVGRIADLAVWDIEHPAELAYWIGHNPCAAVVKDGVLLTDVSPHFKA